MTQDVQFAAQVRMKAPPEIARDAVEEAIGHHLETGKTSRADLVDAIQLARRFADLSAPREEQQGGRGPIEFGSLENVVTSDLLIEQLQPEIERLRIELFGDSEPPFPVYDDAVEWIEQELTEGKPARSAAQRREHLHVFQEELDAFAERWSSLFGYHLYLDTRRLALKFAHPARGRVLERGYWSESKIPKLHYFVMERSRRTGFPEESLVAYILSGIDPVIPDVRTKAPLVYLSGTVPQIQITFNKKHIGWQDLRRAYALIKEQLENVPSVVSHEDHALVLAIKRLGGIPPWGRGRMDFWDEVRRTLTDKGVDVPSDHAVRVRFRRLKDKGVNAELLDGLYRRPAEGDP